MRQAFGALCLTLLLAACGQASGPVQSAQSTAGGYAVADQDHAVDERATPAASTPVDTVAVDNGRQRTPSQQPPSDAVGGMYLAYVYQMGLELPSARLPGVMDAHVRACQTAGPRLCQLIGANRSGDPDSDINGTVDLRGEPNWLRTFIAGVGAQVNAAGGRVTSQATTTEDLTRSIIDTQAHLHAETTLRDRLQQLLQSRPGRLADLLDVERELARVQGDIDSTQSNLAVMRARVDMSELTLSYASAPRPVGSNTMEPLRQALANFLGVVVIGFAAIITLIAGLLPFAIVLIPTVWGLLAWRRRRGGRFFQRVSPPPPPPAANT